ncbi:uncharacterized protein LOC141898716 isoform X2 [Tubulanus polymorphus]|uniref:uncharacterized protein LOC141898716 isoform X2 n=1 Tax=Tubulanus polymorphus TaxID=672921 RepID=UPI003DA67196
MKKLLQAIDATTTKSVLESLTLQHKNHLKQQEIILLKQKQQEQALKLKAKKLKDDKRQQKKNEMIQQEEKDKKYTDDTELNNYLIYRTMTETDSLLQFISNQGHVIGSEQIKSDALLNRATQESFTAAMKQPKCDQVIIEELRIHNEELCKLLKKYITKFEYVENENRLLKAKLTKYETMTASTLTEEEYSAIPGGMHIADDETLDLPPLDTPKFDFDAFKDFDDSSTSLP